MHRSLLNNDYAGILPALEMPGNNPFYVFLHFGVFSSVGLEHYLDRVGVDGSNPPIPTRENGSRFFR